MVTGPVVPSRRLHMPALSIGSALVSRLSQYVVLVLVARLLPPEDFGAFALLAVLSAVVTAIASGGGDMWLNRFTWHDSVQAYRAPRVWRVYLIACVIAAAMALVLSVAASLLFGGVYAKAAVLAFVAAAITGLSEALLAVLRASNFIGTFFLMRDILGPLAYIGMVLIVRPDTPEAVFGLQMILSLVMLLSPLLIIGLNAGTLLPVVRVRHNTWPWVVRHTLGLVLGNLSSRLALHIDVMLIGFFVSLSLVGEYRVAAQVAIGFIIVQHFFFLGLPWQIRDLGTASQPGRGFKGVLERQLLLNALGAVALVVLWVAAEPLLGLLGDRFRSIAWVFRLLLVLRYVELLWGPQHEILVSKGRVEHDVAANLLSIIAWVACLLVLQPFTEPLKAAVVSNVAASMARNGYRHVLLVRLQVARPFGQPLGPLLPVLASLGIVAVVLLSGSLR